MERGLDLSHGLYKAYRASTRTLAQMAAYTSVDMNVVADDEPERLEVTSATATLTSTLAITPRLGRFYTEAEDVPGGAPVAVIGEGYWLRRFGGAPSVIGRTVSVNGVAHEIIGVMPRDVAFPSSETPLWIPLRLDPATTSLGGFSLRGIGRLAPGATPAVAARELASFLPRIEESIPDAAGLIAQVKLRALVSPLKDHVVGDVQRTLWILLGAVGFVLLIGAANITGLFMVRAESRQREIAVRTALGAGRATLLRHALAESVLLSAAGGALGVVLGWWTLGLLRTGSAANLPRRDELGLDANALIATSLIVAVVAVLFALPSWLQRVRVSAVLREAGRGLTSGRQRTRARGALVAGQVALAVVLMVGAGLMMRSFWRVSHVNPGFDAARVMTFELGLSRNAYDTPERAVLAHRTILERLRALPGVEGVGASSCLPFCGRWAGDGWRAQDRPLGRNEPAPVGALRVVSADYLATLRVPVVAGRTLAPADETGEASVVVISAQLAHRLWPGEDPIGRRISNRPASADAWYTVVGVVGNTPIRDATEDPAPMVYIPLRPSEHGPDPRQLAVVVRAASPPEALAAAIRREVAAVDPALPVARMQTLDAIVRGSSARMALVTLLLGGAAAVALLLGVLGVYGVIAYVVARRIPEFGLRLALGASKGDIVAMLVQQGGRMLGAGLGVGLLAAFALSGAMRTLLYGVAPGDPVTFAAAALVLALAGLAAVVIPSRRAARVDPSTLLRSD